MVRQPVLNRALPLVMAMTAWLASSANPALAGQVCTYDPELGPNPLGMRTYITLIEVEEGTDVLFEQLPSPVGADANPPVTVALQRSLTFYDTDIEETRRLLLTNPEYYNVLVDYPDPEGFAPINAVLSCS